jgi:WD40 repeat protein
MKVSTKSIRSLSHNEKEKKIYAGSSDNYIYIIDTIKISIIAKLSGHKNSVFCTSLFGKNKILSGSRDAQLASWNMESQSIDKIVVAHMATINSLSLNPNNNLLATASRDKTIKLWEADSLNLLKVIENQKMPAHQRSVNKILWLDDNYLISASDDTKVILWCIENN